MALVETIPDEYVKVIKRQKRDVEAAADPSEAANNKIKVIQPVGLVDTLYDYMKHISFVRGVIYTTLPVTVISLILLAAYRRDLHSARSSTSPIFKYPMILSLLLSFIAPFLMDEVDQRLVSAMS